MSRSMSSCVVGVLLPLLSGGLLVGCGDKSAPQGSGYTLASMPAARPGYVPGRGTIPLATTGVPSSSTTTGSTSSANYLDVGSPYWHENDQVGQPLKTHSAAEAEVASAVLDGINAQRTQAGLPALALDDAATRAAKAHSEDMAGRSFFDHLTPEGWTPQDRFAMLGGTGARTLAENLLQGSADPTTIVQTWMGSAQHRANILNTSMTHAGIGVAGGLVTAVFVGK